MQKSYFGIDFGTTNTAVVQLLVDDYGAKTIYCCEDDMPFPSLLAIHKENGTVLFGRQLKVKRQQLSRDYHIFSSFKSILGKEQEFTVAGRTYTPTDITALFLRGIKDYVKANMELDINAATFAIPVDFTPSQRRELKKAAKAAGINVNKFISEPTAAYMRNIDLVKGLSKVAVFDWGGGTLDVSILEIEKNALKELAVNGKQLGGNDIDKLLAKKIHADIAAKSSIGSYDEMSDKDKDTLLAKCEDAKITLSDDDFCRIQLIDYGTAGVIRYPLELERFKEIIQPQIDQAVEVLYEAIKKAHISVAQLDAIIMVGGSCEMQPIQEVMEALFARKNIQIIYPEKMQWSVAVGAAMVETSTTSYRLEKGIGVVLSDDSFFPIFEKGTSVPCMVDEIRFGVAEDTTDAHFIIADENMTTLKIANVPVKGFTTEGISLNAYIDEDMIANISLQSTHMPRAARNLEINKLALYYDLNKIEKPNEASEKENYYNSGDPGLCSYAGCTEKVFRGGFCQDHYIWEHSASK